MLDIATRQQKAHPTFSFMLQLFNSCREFVVLWNPQLAGRSLYRSVVRNHPLQAMNVSWLYIVLAIDIRKFANYSKLGTCCTKHTRDGTQKIYNFIKIGSYLNVVKRWNNHRLSQKYSNRIESNEPLVNEIAKFSLLVLSNNLCITYIFFHFLFFSFCNSLQLKSQKDKFNLSFLSDYKSGLKPAHCIEIKFAFFFFFLNDYEKNKSRDSIFEE